MLSQIVFLVLVVSCISCSECARILAVSPLPSYSHQVAFRPIWKELSLRGHNVTLITTDPINNSSLTNLTEIDIHDVTYQIWRSSGIVRLMQQKETKRNPFSMLDKYMNVFGNLTDTVLEQKEVKQLLESDMSFDLVITEPLLTVGLGFADWYKSKLIFIMSLDATSNLHAAMGNPTHPVLYPEIVFTFSSESYITRVLATFFSLSTTIFRSRYQKFCTDLLRKHFGENTSSLRDIIDKTNMLFVNVNPIFGGVRPVTPSTIYFGRGSHLEPERPLPTDLQDYLDGSKEGAVYFSLGTNVLSKDLSEEVLNVILDTFRELPYRVLWKFEDDRLMNLPANVKIAKWIPQQDVLRHPNVKAFITQGGLQSTEEAIFSKVPMIGMPQIADQANNIKRVVELGMGLLADFDNLNKEDLKQMVFEVIKNPSYRENMEEFVKLSIDWPMNGIEETVWWTEYVLRHNNTEHLKGVARKVPIYQYYLLDVIGGVTLVVLVITYLSVKLIKFIWRRFSGTIITKFHND